MGCLEGLAFDFLLKMKYVGGGYFREPGNGSRTIIHAGTYQELLQYCFKITRVAPLGHK